MGRPTTGAWTTDEALQIDLSYLLRHQYFVRGKDVVRVLRWTRQGKPVASIYLVTLWSKEESPILCLNYKTTDQETGEVERRTERIHLEALPSNLGKGEVLYFLCPESGRRCRMLYKAYESRIWKSRGAYERRLYYPCQQCSKIDVFNTRYWEIESKIKKTQARPVVKKYRRQVTRRYARLQELEHRKIWLNYVRWSAAAYSLGLKPDIFDDNAEKGAL